MVLPAVYPAPCQAGAARRWGAYIKRLETAGYLQVLRKGKAATPGIWRLKPAMNTGPKPTKILRSKLVYDANLKQIMGPVLAEEVAA